MQKSLEAKTSIIIRCEVSALPHALGAHPAVQYQKIPRSENRVVSEVTKNVEYQNRAQSGMINYVLTVTSI